VERKKEAGLGEEREFTIAGGADYQVGE